MTLDRRHCSSPQRCFVSLPQSWFTPQSDPSVSFAARYIPLSSSSSLPWEPRRRCVHRKTVSSPQPSPEHPPALIVYFSDRVRRVTNDTTRGTQGAGAVTHARIGLFVSRNCSDKTEQTETSETKNRSRKPWSLRSALHHFLVPPARSNRRSGNKTPSEGMGRSNSDNRS